MKNIGYLAVILMIAMVYGCSENDKFLDPEEHIRLGTWTLNFPEAGGSLPAAVAATASWKSRSAQEWITVEDHNDRIEITVGPNQTGSDRGAYVYVETLNRMDSVWVEQTARASADLSASGTANSYIAAPSGSYKFDARVKGNGGGDGNSRYIQTLGAEITGQAVADLIWEATFDGDKTRSRRIIDGMPVYTDGFIYFRTGDIEGNALLAVRSSSGEILWSWHIWVVADEVRKVEGNGFQWMDRNLGALNNTPGDRDNRGMMYQWGRKDPFLPTYVPYQGLYDTSLKYNPDNTETGDGSATWNYNDYMAQQLVEAPGSIPFAIENPTTFIRYFGTLAYGNQDWYLSELNEDDMNSFLWGKEDDASPKTIFDPCPPGYLVPPAEAYIIGGSTANPRSQWSRNSNLCEEFDYGVSWSGCNDEYFPMPGHRVGDNGQLTYCGNIGDYWTRSPISEADEAGVVYFNMMQDDEPGSEDYLTPMFIMLPDVGVAKAFAMSMRCVAE